MPVRPLPSVGEVFLDARGGGRALRVSWHTEVGLVVLSLWSGGACTGSFRLPAEDVPELIRLLSEALVRSVEAARDHSAGHPSPPTRLQRGSPADDTATPR